MRHKPSDIDSNCEDCGESKGQCKCDALAIFYDEVANVMAKLDDLAEVWGDEAVFRRCRDSLRKSLAKVEYERDSPALEPGPAPLVWSSERPKVAGMYWVRFKTLENRSLRNPWTMLADAEYLGRNTDCDVPSNLQFAGPIPSPQEPT